jgi:hypothetical protein
MPALQAALPKLSPGKQRVLRLRFNLDPGRWSALRTIARAPGSGKTAAAVAQDAFVGVLHLAHHAGVDDAARGGAHRLQLERLPAYAPDLNPVEYVWRYLKHGALRNVCCDTLDELPYELRLAIANLRHKPAVLSSWPKHCGYQL